MATDLPEDSQLKRRARRRLIGAIALVLLAVIVLPMIFDAEQKPLDQDVSIQIPSQGDYVAKPPPAGSTPPAAKAGDKDAKAAPEPPPKDTTPPAPPKDETKSAPPADAPKAAPKDAPKEEKAEAPKAGVKADGKADEAKAAAAKAAEAKAASDAKVAKAAAEKAADEKARAQAEAKRAVALLNGAGDAPTSTKSAKADPAEKAAAGSFAIQIGAFSAEEKAQEVRDKLSAAGLKSYAEKVATKSGDVTRVRAGPFASKDAAESARAKIAGLGFASATVVHR
ncbi:MAG: hypothetical protein JWN73_4661 [Betaproteobacteria bacterium]|nr:hypothetical protein [Betaproteobacteria bacterium]